MHLNEAALPFRPGDTIAGKYELAQVIGTGGMGVVVAARHIDLDERVAIKFLVGRQLEPLALERFLREARAAAKVKSEHICRVFDVGRLPTGEPYMVMELLDGIDLAENLARAGPQPVEVLAGWVIEACAALVEAHGVGIVHRDLKPANMFLANRADGSTTIKLLDFGISKVENETRVTKTATVVGTPVYMSPEQIASSRNVDARADIWSLGVILYELSCGRPPFDGESAIQIAMKVVRDPLTPLTEVIPEVSPAFAAIVERCLAKAPDERFADAKELALALAELAPPEARYLATRIARSRPSRTLDPALLATAQDTPSLSAIGRIEATAPNEIVTSSSPAAAPAVAHPTLSPLDTTATTPRPSSPRRSHAVVAALLVVVTLTIAIVWRVAMTDRRQHTVASADPTPAVAASPSSAAPVVAVPPIPPAPLATTSEVATSPTAPRTAAAASVKPAASTTTTITPERRVSTSSASSPAASSAPPPASASAPAGKTRSIDRNDPF